MSRKKLGIRLSIIAIISTLFTGIISLLRVKVILNNYGTEINGLIQVALQMSSYLSLMESGMTLAYQYKMYPKINNKDYYGVSRLYKGLKFNMLNVSKKMFIICSILPIIYSIFVNRSSISYTESVLILFITGCRFVAPYIFIVPQSGILSAFEKQYLVDIIQVVVSVLVFISEVIAINIFKPSIYIVLMINIVFIIGSSPIYTKLVKKVTNIYIDKNGDYDMTPMDMTKDILIHQVSSTVFYNTDNVLLSIFSNLNMVTMYSAFNTLISYPNQLINKVIGGLKATLAMKIQSNDSNAIDIYNYILSIESFCASIVVPIFILMSNDFVTLWIGKDFTLNWIDTVLFGLIILNRMISPIIIAARDAKGLYKESKIFTIMQSVLNIVISILLIKPLGITGLLIGTVLSGYIISTPCNFKLVNDKVFNFNSNLVMRYINVAIVYIIVMLVDFTMFKYIFINISWYAFIFKFIYLFITTLIVSTLIYLVTDEYFLKLLKNIKPIEKSYYK